METAYDKFLRDARVTPGDVQTYIEKKVKPVPVARKRAPRADTTAVVLLAEARLLLRRLGDYKMLNNRTGMGRECRDLADRIAAKLEV